MFEWLFSADTGVLMGTFGFITGVASLIYARSQAKGAHAQVEGAREQAEEALLAAELVAKNARTQAVEALRAAGLVAENARLQAAQAVRAAERVADSAISARMREMRSRNLALNPRLPSLVKARMRDAGGAAAYALVLDAIDIGQEIYLLRKSGVVSDDHWRAWMNEQLLSMASSTLFHAVFRDAAAGGALSLGVSEAFAPLLEGRTVNDPWPGPGAAPAAAPGALAESRGQRATTESGDPAARRAAHPRVRPIA